MILLSNVNEQHLVLFSKFIVPGFISMKYWSLLTARDKLDTTKELLEITAYGLLNYFLISIISTKFNIENDLVLFVLLLSIPIITTLILFKIRNLDRIKCMLLSPTATSWDYFFQKRESCFILIHLNNGNKIAGFYGQDSHSSHFPNKKDIYLEQVWELDDNNAIKEPVPYSKGVFIDESSIYFIEFLNCEDSQNSEESQNLENS